MWKRYSSLYNRQAEQLKTTIDLSHYLFHSASWLILSKLIVVFNCQLCLFCSLLYHSTPTSDLTHGMMRLRVKDIAESKRWILHQYIQSLDALPNDQVCSTNEMFRMRSMTLPSDYDHSKRIDSVAIFTLTQQFFTDNSLTICLSREQYNKFLFCKMTH